MLTQAILLTHCNPFSERERRSTFERKVWSKCQDREGECGRVRLACFTREGLFISNVYAAEAEYSYFFLPILG